MLTRGHAVQNLRHHNVLVYILGPFKDPAQKTTLGIKGDLTVY